MTLEMKSDRIIRLTHRQSNRAALVRGDHMALPARVRHIRAEALQQRIRHAGEKANARRLQPVNKPSSFNHLSPSFHIREAYLFTIHYCLFPAPYYAPRPWGMQPNTSFRLRMCISPLMSRSNIIPFFPCTNPLQTHHIPINHPPTTVWTRRFYAKFAQNPFQSTIFAQTNYCAAFAH